MRFKTYLNNKPIFSYTSGTPQYYPLLRFSDWNFVRILYGTRIYCFLCTSVIIILHHWITLLPSVNERCMRLLIMQFYSSCWFLFRRALPCLRPLVADPWIRKPGFGTRSNPLGMYGRECNTGTSFFLSTSGFLCHYHSTIFHLHTFHSPSTYFIGAWGR